MNRPFVQFGIGAAVGFAGAIIGTEISLLGMVAAVVTVIIVGLRLPRFAALSGGLIAMGLTWFLLGVNSVAICSSTDTFCGAANFLPLLVISLTLFAAGLVAGAVTLVAGIRHKHGASSG
jgi:hypothetical protein